MILALVLAAALPSVDPAVRELRACATDALAFRTADEGWVVSTCGDFVSKDAGRGWEHDVRLEQKFLTNPAERSFMNGYLTFIRWFSPTEGVAGGFVGARIFRTLDAGQTWSEVPIPAAPMVYTTFVRGSTMWMCGSSGEIFRTDDRGRAWRKVASPFDDGDRCVALAFAEKGKGEAAGMNGSRWTTSDDGATWRNDVPANRDIHVVDVPLGGGQDGRVSIAGGRTFTIDPRGRLTVEERGKPKRVHPLVSVGSGRSVPLLGVGARPQGQFGWTADALYLTDDAGESWYRVGDLPVTPDRLTFLNDEAVVLEAGAAVHRSEQAGRFWKLSAQPAVDRGDADVARGKPAPAPRFACLAKAKRGALTVGLSVQGCFGGSERKIAFDVRDGNVEVTGATPMPRATFDTLVTELGARVTRLEQPMGCTSTTTETATVTWSCDGAAPETMSFETNGCGSEEGVAASTSFQTGPATGYARALGIRALVAPLLKDR